MTDYHPLLWKSTLAAANDLAEMTEYEAAGVLLRASQLIRDGEDYQPILNLLRGASDSCVQELAVRICTRVLTSFQNYLATT